MNEIPLIFAKLVGLLKSGTTQLKNAQGNHKDYGLKYCGLSEAYLLEFNQQLNHLQAELKKQLPNLYADLVAVKASRADDEDEKGHHLAEWIARIEYLLEVRAHSRIGEQESAASDRPKHILVSHGAGQCGREVSGYIKKNWGVKPLAVNQKEIGSTKVLKHLAAQADQCSFAIVVVAKDDEGYERTAFDEDWLLYEIAFLQGRCGICNVCLLHQEGLSVPDGLPGVIYISFPRDCVSAAWGALDRGWRSAT